MMKSVKIHTSNVSFFLCDIQEKFRPHTAQFDTIVSIANKLVKASGILNIPLIATEQVPKNLGKLANDIELDKESKLVHLFEKTKFSMLTGQVKIYMDDLKVEKQLKSNSNEIHHIVLFGIEAHVCIFQTCQDLLRSGYNVHVVADGISSMNPQEIKIALQTMRQDGATITTSDSILFQILGDSNHPQFKAISKLVKEYQSVKNPLLD